MGRRNPPFVSGWVRETEYREPHTHVLPDLNNRLEQGDGSVYQCACGIQFQLFRRIAQGSKEERKWVQLPRDPGVVQSWG